MNKAITSDRMRLHRRRSSTTHARPITHTRVTSYGSVDDDADVQSVVMLDCCHGDVSLVTAAGHRSTEVSGRDGYVMLSAIRPILIHATSSIAHRLPISAP